MIKYESSYYSGICNICHDLVNKNVCEKITSKFTGRVVTHTKINNAERSSAHLVHRECLELWRNTGHQTCPECRLQVATISPSLSEIVTYSALRMRMRQIDLTYIFDEVMVAGVIHMACIMGTGPFLIPASIMMHLVDPLAPVGKKPVWIPTVLASPAYAIVGITLKKKWMEGLERELIWAGMGAVLGSYIGFIGQMQMWQTQGFGNFLTFMSISTATSYTGYRIGKLASCWI
jgi:hypothetical protein